jgi:hypothetical protein
MFCRSRKLATTSRLTAGVLLVAKPPERVTQGVQECMDNASHLQDVGLSAQPVPHLTAKGRSAAARRLADTVKHEVHERTSGKIHGLRVEVRDATVRLQGRCATFYCKQLAQHAAMALIGDGTLINEIAVS